MKSKRNPLHRILPTFLLVAAAGVAMAQSSSGWIPAREGVNRLPLGNTGETLLVTVRGDRVSTKAEHQSSAGRTPVVLKPMEGAPPVAAECAPEYLVCYESEALKQSICECAKGSGVFTHIELLVIFD